MGSNLSRSPRLVIAAREPFGLRFVPPEIPPSPWKLEIAMETQAYDGMATAVPVAPSLAVPDEKYQLPVWDPAHLRLAIAAAGVALWSWNVDTNQLTMDERAFELWGVPLSEYVTFDDLSAHIHPADRDRVKAAFAATRAIVGAYEIDFRIMIGDEVHWISAIAIRKNHRRHGTGTHASADCAGPRP